MTQHSTGTPTKDEQAHLDAIHAMDCIACEIEKTLTWQIVAQIGPTEAHHLVDLGTRKLSGGHKASLPLCLWHHRAEVPEDIDAKLMRRVYGPSKAKHGIAFTTRYGTDRELLAKVELKLTRAA